MADLRNKPAPFKAGQRKLSAGALNDMLEAIPCLITGGAGINVSKMGDRIVVSKKEEGSRVYSRIALATIVFNGSYRVLACRLSSQDSGRVLVAMAQSLTRTCWGYDKGSGWWSEGYGTERPRPISYTDLYGYEDEMKYFCDWASSERGAIAPVLWEDEKKECGEGEIFDYQRITPQYEAGEQLLVVRIPEIRIPWDFRDPSAGYYGPIKWMDLNTAGRRWAADEWEWDK